MLFERKIYIGIAVTIAVLLPSLGGTVFSLRSIVRKHSMEVEARQTALIEAERLNSELKSILSVVPLFVLSADPALAQNLNRLEANFRNKIKRVRLRASPAEAKQLKKIAKLNQSAITTGKSAIALRINGALAEEVNQYLEKNGPKVSELKQAVEDIVDGREKALDLAKEQLQLTRYRTDRFLIFTSTLILLFALAVAYLLIRQVRTENKVTRTRKEAMEIVAHDLKSPIATIRMTLDLLGESGGDRNLLAIVSRALGNMERLTGDILDRGRIEAGQMKMDFQVCDVNQLIDEVVQNFQPQAQDKKVRLLAHHAETAAVLCDRNRFEQVLANLIGNGLKFTPAGGEVLVSASNRSDGMEISVRDSGPGIAPEALPQVFDRYWQVKDKNKIGSGLGLAIVKGIVEEHGGHVSVDSAPGSGAVFTVNLPVAEARAQI